MQVGHKIDEEPVHNARHLTILTSAGSVVEIQRKKRGIGSWFTTDLKPLSQFITKNFLLKETSIEDTGWSITVDRTDLLSQELIWMTTNEVRFLGVLSGRFHLKNQTFKTFTGCHNTKIHPVGQRKTREVKNLK